MEKLGKEEQNIAGADGHERPLEVEGVERWTGTTAIKR
jgi:hypothetical protein